MSRLFRTITLLVFFATASFSQGPVAVIGALKACTIGGKGQICGSGAWANSPVQLRGVSLGWSNTGWESSNFFNAATVNAMVDSWKAEIIRVPLGYSETGGYKTDATNWTRAKAAVDAAIAKGVYVIIDWHSHSANTETDAAKTFFETTVAAYHNNPHVIFEIFNEPIDQNWTTIKSYSQTIISAIRAKNANNLILVGTPEYSARPAQASGNYLSDGNIAYVFHFYAYSHKINGGDYDNNLAYSSGVVKVMNEGKPVFVTEYGTTHSDGGLTNGNGAPNNGNHYDTHDAASSNEWHSFMDIHKISSAAWNVNHKKEGSAFFGLGSFNQTVEANYINESMMTPSGKYIFNKLKGYANSAHWRTSNVPPTGNEGGGNCGANCTIIDDFEDGDNLANTLEPWYIYTDVGDGGASTFANERDEEGDAIVVYQDGSNWVAGIKNYTLVKAANEYGPYVALGLDAKNNQIDYDFGKCTDGFSYKFKGSAHNFKAQQSDVTDFAYHFYQEPTPSADWKTVIIAPSLLKQPSTWGKSVAQDLKKIEGFSWEVKGSDGLLGAPVVPNPSALTGSLVIDDFTCLGNMGISPILRFAASRSNSLFFAGGVLSMELKGATALDIFDLQGKKVFSANLAGGSHAVSLQSLPKGVYFAVAKSGSWRQMAKIAVF
ncbi:MAG: cellulase family glycosylhydrolase [Fibromonadaceae bacterium]|jgi:endoglucanase|nr:cellulase family glycosylhydrolase [Fibromonadaceae bacterium]